MEKLMDKVIVPLDVPAESRRKYKDDYLKITRGSGRLMLFAGDQKAEHLNDDFFGPGVDPQDSDPEHLFKIAERARIGAFATQLGLIARYGMDYPDVPYLVKLNSKTNLVKTSQAEPNSPQWIDVGQAVKFKESSGLDILGVGYTVYLGSEHEGKMLSQAAQIVWQAIGPAWSLCSGSTPAGKQSRTRRNPTSSPGQRGWRLRWEATLSRSTTPARRACYPQRHSGRRCWLPGARGWSAPVGRAQTPGHSCRGSTTRFTSAEPREMPPAEIFTRGPSPRRCASAMLFMP